MTIHSFHPSIHVHGLQDGCPRCEEHAQNPTVGLDAEMLQMLRNRIDRKQPPRTKLEGVAMYHLLIAGVTESNRMSR